MARLVGTQGGEQVQRPVGLVASGAYGDGGDEPDGRHGSDASAPALGGPPLPAGGADGAGPPDHQGLRSALLRVLLDTSYALRGPSGTATYLRALARALPAAGVEVVTAADAGRPAPGGGGWRSARNAARDALWLHGELPRRARAGGADVVHHPLPAWSRRIAVPQVVTVHDLAFVAHPEHFDPRFARVAARTHRVAAVRAGAVVVPSEATRRELLAAWPVDPGRVVVAPHGVDVDPVPGTTRPEHLLYVGDDEPRKDLATLRAAHRPDLPPLVLAGTPRRGDDAGWVVRPDAARLRALLEGAFALVHPAVHEGFGLTVLEAMAAGVPVVAAASDAVVEVAGDAALLVVPGDPAALAGAIERVVGDPGLRSDLRRRGLERAAGFTWSASARAHAAAYALSRT